jgi:DNA polymerase-3 subunit epsilon
MTSEDSHENLSLEKMARELEASGLYRVLRKLDVSAMLEIDDGSPTRTGIFVDVESTGLNSASDEVIEIALLPFKYSLDGRIFSFERPIHQLNEPRGPLPPEITAITGITDEMLKGRRLAVTEIEACLKHASIIVAHNAAFDRPFTENLSPVFAEKPWACTMSDVPWKEEGVEGRRLADLLSNFHYFFGPHRAVDDCHAGLALLACQLPRSGRRVLERLLENARESIWRIFAVDAAFHLKDLLKSRGYRWNSDRAFGPRAWWIDLNRANVETELNFLREKVLGQSIEIPVFEISAFNRYSLRAG